MTASVDFGSHRIRVLTLQDDKIVAKQFRSVYSVLPDSQEQRAILGRLGLPYAACENHLAVIGDHADELRCVNSLPAVPIFSDGQITADDPPARQILNVLVESMLPLATHKNQTCAVVTPGSFKPGTGSPEFLEKIIGLRGYTPLQVNAGQAIVLAEGAANRFSAIGVSFGSQCCDIALVARGNLIDREVVSKGGDWMDLELARQSRQYVYDREGQCYLDTGSVSNWKEASFRSLDRRDSVLEHTLGNLYSEMLKDVVSAIERIVERNLIQSGNLPVLCNGGVATIDGFSEAMRHAFRGTKLSSKQVGEIRIVSDPLAIARGGLINVTLQNETKAAA
jgi:hypothetical protein